MTATRTLLPLALSAPLALGLALGSCRGTPETTPPDGPAATGGAPVEVIEPTGPDPATTDPTPATTEAPPTDPTPTTDPSTSGDAVAEVDPPTTTTTSGGEPGSTSTPSKASAGLPSPIFGKGNSACGRDPGVGEAVKPFALKTPAGKDISLQSLKGKVVLLNFWGTWCKPCLKELPEFERLYRRYKKNGLVLLAIATDTDPAPVDAFARERKLSAKMAIGGEEVANAYKSPNFPFSFVVDPKGVIRASYRGFKPECLGQLEQDLRAELEKSGS